MKVLAICSISMFILIYNARAQYGNVWNMFSNPNSYVTMDFNGPQMVYSQGGSNTGGLEGVSNICNENGQLLFHAYPHKVLDRNNNIMPNGDSLGGGISAYCGSIIVTNPADSNQFYIFSVADGNGNGTTNGLSWSLVDMDLNGGFGAVVSKANKLMDTACEKVTATRHCNGVDWWVVVQQAGTANYFSYLVSLSGVDTIPVISTSGQVTHNLVGPSWVLDGDGGSMKISPNGRRLGNSYQFRKVVEVIEFDNNTGQLGSVLLHQDFSDLNHPDRYGSGISFSPNSNIFYAHLQESIHSNIFQYNLSSNDSFLIHQTKYPLIDFVTTYVFLSSGVQLSPKGNIYLSGGTDSSVTIKTFHIIDLPNSSGSGCSLSMNVDTISSAISRFPFFPDCIFARHHKAVMHLPLCGGLDSAIAVFDTLLNVVHDFTWNFGDPASGANNTATGTDPVHAFTAPGNYTITITATNACNTFTITRNVFIGISTAVPPVITQNGFQLESTPGVSYQWFFNGQPIPGATFQSIIPTQAGMYTVQVSDAGGCVLQSEGFYLYVTQSMQKEKSQLKIYPNPASQQVYIQSGSPVVSVQAINMSGQCINLSYRSFGTYDVADVSTLPKGLYMLLVQTNEGMEKGKVLVN